MLCRVRQKGNNSKNSDVDENKLMDDQLPTIAEELPSSYMTATINSDIMSRFKDFQLMAAILVSHDLPPMHETCSPKLLQDDSNDMIYEDGTFGFDEAHQGWVI